MSAAKLVIAKFGNGKQSMVVSLVLQRYAVKLVRALDGVGVIYLTLFIHLEQIAIYRRFPTRRATKDAKLTSLRARTQTV
jgi:hypothetical protein